MHDKTWMNLGNTILWKKAYITDHILLITYVMSRKGNLWRKWLPGAGVHVCVNSICA